VLLEQLDVALAVAAEVEVLPHHDDLHGERLDEHPVDELVGELLGLGDVERQHDGGVDAGGGEQLQALVR
jgi:hypothetical protein